MMKKNFWIRENQDEFLGGTGWNFRQLRNCKKGGFGTVFVLSHPENKRCVVKLVSLVQLLDLMNSETDDEKKLLDQCKEYMRKKIDNIKRITNDKKSSNLCKILAYTFIPYGDGNPDPLLVDGEYSRILADYIICIKMELLQEINYVRDFCDSRKILDEELLIEFGIKMCDSLIQLDGYYHRDLHPGNFMLSLDENRTVKLIDFDTILENGNNAPHLDFIYEARCDDSSSGFLCYKSPDARQRYDIFDDIYSVGCILYDIANYDFLSDKFNPRKYDTGTGELLKGGAISDELFAIIKKAGSRSYRNRFSDWHEFKEALFEIKDKWKKYRCLNNIPNVCEVWSCKKKSEEAIMRKIYHDNQQIKEKYKWRNYIYKTFEEEHMHLPKLIEEYMVDGDIYFIEEQPPGVSLKEYLSSLNNFNNVYYNFVCRLLKNYVKLLSKKVRGKSFCSKKLVTYKNLITPDNIFIINYDDIWIRGIAIPEEEYTEYSRNGEYKNYITGYQNNNEFAAIYSLGVLLYDILTGHEDRMEISSEQRGYLIDLMNACLSEYEEYYTIDDIERYIDNYL